MSDRASRARRGCCGPYGPSHLLPALWGRQRCGRSRTRIPRLSGFRFEPVGKGGSSYVGEGDITRQCRDGSHTRPGAVLRTVPRATAPS
ncbi:hypothetical protein STRTUCAR8_07663 [Streptomyces turgidiscabies Car8]|uniref:Uncharacterized protein n=1 Tax=Streptomyces turgidiscabies (strain Car8) TaxID=698760 RepID=L7EUC3_STRT8|nr:hypothetical protein STRTUCAR8_07663 [Streptomyces turgidiscabies Car8]